MSDNKEKITLDFYGPFKFVGDNSIFTSPFAKSPGIYIWTVKDELNDTNYVTYVGETTSFAKRHREHFTQLMGLNYRIIDVEAAKKGTEVIVWNGMWRDRSVKATDNLLTCYESISRNVVDVITYYNIYFAPVYIDKQLRRHIEGCIGLNLRQNHKDLTVFYPDDNHITFKGHKYDRELIINLPEEIAGVDLKQYI